MPGPRKRINRLQVYLMPTVDRDNIVMDIWKAAKNGRPQELLRSLVWAGIVAQMKSGELPLDIVQACKLEERIGIKHGADADNRATVVPPPYMLPGYPPAIYAPMPTMPGHVVAPMAPPSAANHPPAENSANDAVTPAASKVSPPAGADAGQVEVTARPTKPARAGAAPSSIELLGLMGGKKD